MNKVEQHAKAKADGRAWKFGIIIFLGSFMLMISFLISKTIGKTPENVREDYYAEDLRSQQTLDELSQPAKLGISAEIVEQQGKFKIAFSGLKAQPKNLLLKFYRPNNKGQDFKLIDPQLSKDFAIALEDERLISGSWKVDMSWLNEGQVCRWKGSFIVE